MYTNLKANRIYSVIVLLNKMIQLFAGLHLLLREDSHSELMALVDESFCKIGTSSCVQSWT